MVFADMSSARLSDGRPQFLGGTGSGLFSIWKVDRDPDAAWSGWQPFPTPFGGVETVAAATLTDGRPQIFACSGDLWTTWKEDPNDADSAWVPWTRFGDLSGTLAVGAASLNDGRPQIFVSDVHGKLWTSWKADGDPNAAWTPLSEFVPGPGPTIKIVSVRLTDGRPQLLLRDSLLSTWKEGGADSAWVLPWQQFTAPPGGGTRSVAGTFRSDGLPQFIAVDSQVGRVWRIHKADADPDAAWSEWIPFPDIAGAFNVCAASLTDGRPQIIVDTPSGLFSTWQQDVSEPDKWVDPTPFEALP